MSGLFDDRVDQELIGDIDCEMVHLLTLIDRSEVVNADLRRIALHMEHIRLHVAELTAKNIERKGPS